MSYMSYSENKTEFRAITIKYCDNIMIITMIIIIVSKQCYKVLRRKGKEQQITNLI